MAYIFFNISNEATIKNTAVLMGGQIDLPFSLSWHLPAPPQHPSDGEASLANYL